jgi:hypothetical protein
VDSPTSEGFLFRGNVFVEARLFTTAIKADAVPVAKRHPAFLALPARCAIILLSLLVQVAAADEAGHNVSIPNTFIMFTDLRVGRCLRCASISPNLPNEPSLLAFRLARTLLFVLPLSQTSAN